MNKTKIIFYVNGKYEEINVDPTLRALDVLRDVFGLLGTKEGCSDGDCGACTIVFGKKENGVIKYISVDSCLIPIAKLNRASVITIEGLSSLESDSLNIIQETIIEKHGVQCGFCTPGVTMSFLGLMLSSKNPSYDDIELALEGNICRCTGYEGIRDSANSVLEFLETCDSDFDILPISIRSIESKLDDILPFDSSKEYILPETVSNLINDMNSNENYTIISGYTDLGVRAHRVDEKQKPIIDISNLNEIKIIEDRKDYISIGANVTLQTICDSNIIFEKLPIFREMLEQMASRQIRNIASIGGNICNASPIGDGVVLLMTLNATIVLLSSINIERRVPLREFYTGYKKMNMESNEIVKSIEIPKENYKKSLSFIKTGKRNAVDIASVNSASRMSITDGIITRWEIAFGGICETVVLVEIPLVTLTSNIEEIEDIGETIASGFNPLSDVRGSSEFRSLLIQGHLVKHFLKHIEREV